MEKAYFGLEVSDFVLLLLDVYSEQCDFFLHVPNFLGVFLVLFLKFSKEMIVLLLQVFDHDFFLLLSIDDQIVLAVGLEGVGDKVVIIRHKVKLLLKFTYVFAQQVLHVFDLLFGSGLFLEHGETNLDGHIVGVIIGNELEFVAVNPQRL